MHIVDDMQMLSAWQHSQILGLCVLAHTLLCACVPSAVWPAVAYPSPWVSRAPLSVWTRRAHHPLSLHTFQQGEWTQQLERAPLSHEDSLHAYVKLPLMLDRYADLVLYLLCPRRYLSTQDSAQRAMALAGGANMILLPTTSAMFQQAGMLSPAGRCRALDSSADGYVRAEGCAVALLGTAARSGNITPPLAVLAATAVNQDGRSSSLTAPNGPAQQEVIRQALADSHVRPENVQALQMHGTGTPLGDPIELGAAAQQLRPAGCDAKPLVLLAVKSSIGHSEPASGLQGLTAAVQQVCSLSHRAAARMCTFVTTVTCWVG